MATGDADIIVVGAGAAGLMAARELGRAGRRVLVLEARDRLGGRIYPLPVAEFGYEAQGGGEFVHGDAPVTSELVSECGGTLTHAIEWWSVVDGDPERRKAHAPIEDAIQEKLSVLSQDMTVEAFFDRYFPGEEHRPMREHAYFWVEGYDAGDPKYASALALRQDTRDPVRWLQRSLKEGYGLLLRQLEKHCREVGVEIFLGKHVTAVDISDAGAAKVRCADGQTYQSAKVLVTVPLPCISQIDFSPAIPDKIASAAAIGYGGVIKILVRFSEKWWGGTHQKDFETPFFMFSREKIRTWWTQYPEPHLTLTGWVAGPSATALSGMPPDQLMELALKSLSNIFHIGIEDLRSKIITSRVVDWLADPFARGAYSYTTPRSVEAIAELRTPVAGTLYFAGEALNKDDNVATVEAALESGQDTARVMLAH